MDTLKEWIISVLSSSMKSMSGMSAMAISLMEFKQLEAGILTTIYAYFAPIAATLVAIYFCTGVITTYINLGKQLDLQAFIKMFAGIIMSDAVIMATPTLVSNLFGLSNFFAVEMNTQMLKAMEDSTKELIDMSEIGLGDLNFVMLMAAGMGAVISGVSSLIATCVLCGVIFSAKLELMLRFAFAQIGLAGFASDDHRHEAMRYFRKMLASALYAGAVVMTLHMAAVAMNASTIENALKGGTGIGNTLENIGENGLAAGAKAKDMVGDGAAGKVAEAAATVGGAYATYGWELGKNSILNVTVVVRQTVLGLVAPFSAIGAITAAKGIINDALGA